MKLVKIGKIPGMLDISEQKVRELIKNGVWEKGVHYYENSALNHKLFDMDAIEQWLKGDDESQAFVDGLVERMIS